MGHYHEVDEYETMRRIAALYGVSVSSIWDAGQNAELRRARTPDHLVVGDRVWVPGDDGSPVIEVGAGAIPLRTGRAYVLSVPQMHDLRVQFSDEESQPMAGWHCALTYPGGSLTTCFDDAGTLRARVPVSALCIDVVFWPPDGDRSLAHRRTLHVGRLEPTQTDGGLRASLQNLGCGGDGAPLGTAIAEFQEDQGMEVTGRADDQLRERVQSLHRADGRDGEQ